MILGSYLYPPNSISKYSNLLPGWKCLPSHSQVVGDGGVGWSDPGSIGWDGAGRSVLVAETAVVGGCRGDDDAFNNEDDDKDVLLINYLSPVDT